MSASHEHPVTSLVVAAGAGTRLAGERPKAFRLLGGTLLFMHALRAFDEAVSIGEHVLVVPAGHEEEAREAVRGVVRKPLRVVVGGARRQDSVMRGLEAVAEAPTRTGGREVRSGPRAAGPAGDMHAPSGAVSGPNSEAASSSGKPADQDGKPSSPNGANAECARLVAVHDAARPFVSPQLIERTIAAARIAGAAIPVIGVNDTVREVVAGERTHRLLDRQALRMAQTPQTARLDWLIEACAKAGREGTEATDEGRALELAGFACALVEGESWNFKITTPQDLETAQAIVAARAGPARCRIGFGEDRHARMAERPFVLAGVVLDTREGPAGHSDGDPLCHALIDALLGAAGEGSIGDHFPDTDMRWSGARGLELLERTVRILAGRGLRIVNVDAVVIADTPRLSPHVPDIRRRLAAVLGVDETRVSVKGKRAEGLGFEGSGSGVTCRAVALVEAAAS